jgi:glycerophosphoryl diester phosphodiesterase
MVAHKPLLSDVIDTVEAYIKAKGLKPVFYNIETKSEARFDGKYNPRPADFAMLLYQMVVDKKIAERVTIQSFDVRTLEHASMYSQDIFLEKVKFALLVENTANVDSALSTLSFTPAVYSPDFKLINKDIVDKLHAKGMKVIPWTVNEDRDIRRVEEMGVDGIISDYPDKVVKLLAKP